MKFYLHIFILFVFSAHHLSTNKANSSICKLPDGCHSVMFYLLDTSGTTEFFSANYKVNGLRCEIRDAHFRFDFDSWLLQNHSDVCRQAGLKSKIELRMTRRVNNLAMSMNLQGVIDFLLRFDNQFKIRLAFMKTIDADLGIRVNKSWPYFWNGLEIAWTEIVNSRLNFLVSPGRVARSCRDFFEANVTNPRSVFHINLQGGATLTLLNCIYKYPVCPLLFKNSHASELLINGMNDHFFRQNVLKFDKYTNNSTQLEEELDSNVYILGLLRCENVALDENLLNPLVFKEMRYLRVYDSINRIDNNIFLYFKFLIYFQSEAHFFRKITHKQGIEWIRAMNRGIVNVNLSDPRDVYRMKDAEKYVRMRFTAEWDVGDVFLNEDFCLYVKFPFEQLVAFQFLFNNMNRSGMLTFVNFDPNEWKDVLTTCTAWWLVQHFPLIRDVYSKSSISEIDFLNIPPSPVPKTCNFGKMLERCHWKQRRFRPKIFINDVQDFSINSMVVIKMFSYVLSLFGLLTNSLVIYIIRRKKNADIFKGFQQFDYLCLISLFNIIILFVQLFAWISDCNLIVMTICLDIRKSVFIQFMRVIVKEALVVAFRFMCNFAYFGFAFNRILLIGRDHPKFVESVGKCKMRKFLAVTGLMSVGFAFVKGFKYRVNYDRSELNYPYNNEGDIWIHNTTALSVYLFFNFIADFCNYIVFLFACLAVDVYMLVRLRQTLDEKLKREKKMNGKEIGNGIEGMTLDKILYINDPKKQINIRNLANNDTAKKNKASSSKSANKKELTLKDSMNNAIRMVVTNSLLNILIKLPLCLISVFNLGYTFAQNKYMSSQVATSYLHFVGDLNRAYFIAFLLEFSEFLFFILISIQLFIYIRFDLKMKAGFKRIFYRKSPTTNSPK